MLHQISRCWIHIHRPIPPFLVRIVFQVKALAAISVMLSSKPITLQTSVMLSSKRIMLQTYLLAHFRVVEQVQALAVAAEQQANLARLHCKRDLIVPIIRALAISGRPSTGGGRVCKLEEENTFTLDIEVALHVDT
jgi:hypothetical protein